MRITGGINNLSNINSLFNTLHQGKVAMYANKLSNSSILFPENKAPGQGAFGSDAVSYINDLKSSSNALSGAIKGLSGSAFSQRTMVSSNTDAMTVNYTGSSQNANTMRDMKVSIDRLATGQLNEGSSLNATANYSGDKGVSRFTIETGGKTTQLSINIAAGDTNANVQQKMATAINNAGLGLKATVETDTTTNASMLRIESSNTGSNEKNAFTLTDVTGNTVASTGANDVARTGQDAIYRVNGGAAQTSQTNTVNLGNGVNATFLQTTGGNDVTISRGRDMESAMSAINDMVNSYNKLFATAAENVNDPKAQGLASRLMNVGKTYSSSLSDIGIGFDSSGRMTINSEKMGQAAESGKLQQFFTENSGKNFGFTNQLGRLADNVSRNTSNFVTSSIFGDALGENFAYSGLGTPQHQNIIRSGSIFDYMF